MGYRGTSQRCRDEVPRSGHQQKRLCGHGHWLSWAVRLLPPVQMARNPSVPDGMLGSNAPSTDGQTGLQQQSRTSGNTKIHNTWWHVGNGQKHHWLNKVCLWHTSSHSQKLKVACQFFHWVLLFCGRFWCGSKHSWPQRAERSNCFFVGQQVLDPDPLPNVDTTPEYNRT